MNKILVSVIVLVIAISAAAFYWYQWIPNQARKECSNPTIRDEIIKTSNNGKFNLDQFMASKKDADYYYEQCLKLKGITK